MEFKYRIEGMHCASCVDKIKNALDPIAESVEVSLTPPLLRLNVQDPVTLEDLNARVSQVGSYNLFPLQNKTVDSPSDSDEKERGWLATYYPIFLIAGYIAGVSLLVNLSSEGLNRHGFMNTFMAGFFLVFSAFKLLNIQGFADAYATYDLLAKRWHGYGYLYPFLELALGILYLLSIFSFFSHIATILLMGFSSLGVIKALSKKQAIRCACLGTVLNVPMSNITLIEDLAMVAMAFSVLFIT
jgi:copper chaperone CopZ